MKKLEEKEQEEITKVKEKVEEQEKEQEKIIKVKEKVEENGVTDQNEKNKKFSKVKEFIKRHKRNAILVLLICYMLFFMMSVLSSNERIKYICEAKNLKEEINNAPINKDKKTEYKNILNKAMLEKIVEQTAGEMVQATIILLLRCYLHLKKYYRKYKSLLFHTILD